MNIGKACAIFAQIDSDKYSDAEKLEAVREVVEMPTHNGITKATMLTVLRWFVENTEPATEQPAADVSSVKHAEWVMIPVNGVATYRCGNIDCCRIIPFGCQPYDLHYCPYCGVKMDGETHEKV